MAFIPSVVYKCIFALTRNKRDEQRESDINRFIYIERKRERERGGEEKRFCHVSRVDKSSCQQSCHLKEGHYFIPFWSPN